MFLKNFFKKNFDSDHFSDFFDGKKSSQPNQGHFYYFNPSHTDIHISTVKKLSKGDILLSFVFYKTTSKGYKMEDGKIAWYAMPTLFKGDLFCEKVVLFKEDKNIHDSKPLKIQKAYFSEEKILTFSDKELGAVKMECLKLSIHHMYRYFKDAETDKWKIDKDCIED